MEELKEINEIKIGDYIKIERGVAAWHCEFDAFCYKITGIDRKRGEIVGNTFVCFKEGKIFRVSKQEDGFINFGDGKFFRLTEEEFYKEVGKYLIADAL
jgi:hypothetical protein